MLSRKRFVRFNTRTGKQKKGFKSWPIWVKVLAIIAVVVIVPFALIAIVRGVVKMFSMMKKKKSVPTDVSQAPPRVLAPVKE